MEMKNILMPVMVKQMPVLLTEEEVRGVKCLLEFEIKSNTDYLDDIKGEEKDCWKKEIEFLEGIKLKLSAC